MRLQQLYPQVTSNEKSITVIILYLYCSRSYGSTAFIIGMAQIHNKDFPRPKSFKSDFPRTDDRWIQAGRESSR